MVGAVAGTLGVILFVAFVVETLVEVVVGEPLNHIPNGEKYKWLLAYVAYAVGVVGAVAVYKFDMIYLCGLWLGAPVESNVFGQVLTGLAIGRGASYVHDLFGWFKKPELPATQG